MTQTLSISSGQQNSPAMTFYAPHRSRWDGDSVATVICAPDDLTGTVTVELKAGNDWYTMQSPPGTDITVAAGKAIVLVRRIDTDFRLHSDQAEVSQRDFSIIR